MDEVNHVNNVSSMFRLMMFCCHLCALRLNVLLPSCGLCTCDHDGKEVCSTVKNLKESKNVIVIIMFHCMHTKSFSGHYDNAKIVVISIPSGVYIKEKSWNEWF